MTKWLTLLSTLLSFLVNPAFAQPEDELLEPDQAFAFTATVRDADTLVAEWRIAPGYYLYKDKIRFTAEGIELGNPELPAGEVKQDEFFGRIETYHGQVQALIPVRHTGSEPQTITLTANSQGCAEDRVCYPPHTQTAQLTLPARDTAPATDNTVAKQATPGEQAPDVLGALKSLAGDIGSGDADFLDADQAFRLQVDATGPDMLSVQWIIADGYYLYRNKIRFEVAGPGNIRLGEATLPVGQIKDDEFFGRIEVYHGNIEARVPVTGAGAGESFDIKVSYQGCAEAGICYPPISKTVRVSLPVADSTAGTSTTGSKAEYTVSTSAGPAETSAPISEQDKLARLLTDSPLWLSMLIFFGLGIGLAFTPCVFPMIPILSSIIIGQGTHITTQRAFTLSLAYVLAMALTYTAAGIIAGMFGANLQAAFQNPWILGSFAAVFVLLSLSMFGFYDLQMPAFLQSKLAELSNRQQGGTHAGVAIMGFLSALIVGPCVAAPLAGALLVIGQTGDAVLGGGALFALSMGMGAPLLAIGTSAGRLMPRAGDWMNTIKAVFGVLLLAVAIWMLERVIPAALAMLMWSVLLIVSGIYMGALEQLSIEASGWRKLWKGVGLVLVVYGVLLMVGMASGGRDITQPLQGVLTQPGQTASSHLDFTTIKSSADLQKKLDEARSSGRAVMLDFYADWCVTCKEMEKYTFSSASVMNALSGTMLLQADVTANDDTDKALMKRFGIIGPPSILFFDRNGDELRDHRVVGFMPADRFTQHVESTQQ